MSVTKNQQFNQDVQSNFVSLEGLRAYMAWCVVFSHAIFLTGLGDFIPYINGLFNGGKAVNVFIILSGFVITHLLISSPANLYSYKSYIVRRGFRIIPIYILALVVSACIIPAQLELRTTAWIANPKYFFDGYNEFITNPWPHILLHISMMHGVVPDNILPFSSWTILGPAWSISLEWQFYLVAPYIIYFLRKSKCTAIGVTFLLCVGGILFNFFDFGKWHYPSFLLLSIHFFLIGIFCRLWFSELCQLPIVVVIGSILISGFVFMSCLWEILVWGFFLVSAIMENKNAVLSSGHQKIYSVIKLATSNKIAVQLGKMSFSTYLIHGSVFSIVAWVGNHFFGLTSQRDVMLLILGSMCLLIPISYVLYVKIEKTFINVGRKLYTS